MHRRIKESPRAAPGAFKVTFEGIRPGIKVPKTPRYYSKAQIRQGADSDKRPGRQTSLRGYATRV
jgi:hypothetical protein